MCKLRTSGYLKIVRPAKFEVREKRTLAVIVMLCVGSLVSTYGEEKAKPEVEIKKIKNFGVGVKKLKVPGTGNLYYTVGSSMERVFTVKIKNNTKREKRDVRVKLSVYDKKGKLMGETSPRNLNAEYADNGYLIDKGILASRKSVKLYFAVDKKAKYAKAELFCGDKLIDVETLPSSFIKELSEKR